MSLLDADLVWVLIAVIAAWLVLGCLKAIGYGYYNAVLWHNLKLRVHGLRLEQKRRLDEIELANQAVAASPRPISMPAVEPDRPEEADSAAETTDPAAEAPPMSDAA